MVAVKEMHAKAHEAMADVLARVQGELEEIARGIDHNQSVIARSTWAAGSTDADYVRAMQDADLSAQRIAGIAGFLRAIAELSDPSWAIDTAGATGTLKLTELIRAIGTAGLVVEAKDRDLAGEVDLF